MHGQAVYKLICLFYYTFSITWIRTDVLDMGSAECGFVPSEEESKNEIITLSSLAGKLTAHLSKNNDLG